LRSFGRNLYAGLPLAFASTICLLSLAPRAGFCAGATVPVPLTAVTATVVAATAVPEVVVDTSQIQGVAGFEAANTFAEKVSKLITDGYPMIVKELGAERAPVPERVTVVFDKDMEGVAATGGTTIHVAAKYAQEHPDDTGMIIHELAHVVQGYPNYDPVWLIEGIADYVRFFHYEPIANRPHPNPAKATCRDSYRTTGAFLDWAVRTHDKKLVKKLDAALKANTYSEDMFRQATGKSLDQLNTEWLASLTPSPK